MDSIKVASTILSDVDGERGHLVVRGHEVDDIAAAYTFEQVAALLWDGLAPTPVSAEQLRADLAGARAVHYPRLLELLKGMDLSSSDAPARALRAALGSLEDNPARDPATLAPPNALAGTGVSVAAALPVAIAIAWRLHAGLAPVPPDPARTHAEDFLSMLRGEQPSPQEVKALDSYLVTVAEHGMNASTFTARVVASTGASIAGAVTAAYCALQGPLHGGAPGPVLDMLDAIGSDARADAWISEQLNQGQRLMGFGHRIYRVRDPRADVLKAAVARLRRTQDSDRLRFAEAVERASLAALARKKPDRPLHTNVEFYTALLLEAVGLPRAIFTPVFAVGRVAGWIAHVYEQRRNGRLIRPQSEYVGPRPGETVRNG